jgi:hypothetical protein
VTTGSGSWTGLEEINIQGCLEELRKKKGKFEISYIHMQTNFRLSYSV